ncbi:MAG: hypothetical protein EB015_07790 [Methylocystaceae bacterium]|nr:hypothetical protein [Methylocystaceae bacterium]
MYAASITSLALCLLLAISSSSFAAELTFERNEEASGIKVARFHLTGEITSNDASALKALLAKSGITREQGIWRKNIVSLDSPGGSFQAGLDLALLFRRQGLATEVRSGGRCFSACAIAFLGGTSLPKDPTPPDEDGEIPNQPPDRSLAVSAQLGFHAPYLDIPANSYNAHVVEEAYRSAIIGISRLIAIADHLYVSSADLPKLLKPTHDDLFMIDTVDAVRFLGIDYTDRTLQFRDMIGFTRSMVRNACVNRYYHLQRRSSLDGYVTASAIFDEFIEGSKLLANGEDKIAFGIRKINLGTGSSWLAFMPIGKTKDDKSFVWCLFDPHGFDPTTFYKPAGTIAALFSSSNTTMTIGDGVFGPETRMRVLDLVPPNTKLRDVGRRIEEYLRDEKVILSR